MTHAGSTVGAGLAAARPARPVEPGERIHIVGVAGAGASAAALLGARAGAQVTGCDAGGSSPYTLALEAAGIPLAWTHDGAHVTTPPMPDRLGVTKALTAVAPDHPELMAARDRGIPTEPWQQLVADAAAERRLVAVAGTHGKSTTAGWLVHVLVAAGQDPSAFVGALLPGSLTDGPPATARWGRGGAFVVEADEYAGNFDPFVPHLAVVTSLDWDHPDVFADRVAVVDAFESWVRRSGERVGAGGERPTVVVNVGDPGVRELVDRLGDWAGRILAVAIDTERDDVDLVGRIIDEDPDGTSLVIRGRRALAGPEVSVRLPTAGRHNATNALTVFAAAHLLGVPGGVIADGLAGFGGVGRRLERKGEAAGVVVYDDYGHHPTAIRATLQALHQREPDRRTWAVYEPLTFHRTAALLDEFADALAGADAVAIADIWPGRDLDTTQVSAAGLAGAVADRRAGIIVAAPGSVEATAAWLAGQVRSGDAVLVMGGGRSYRIGELLLESLRSR